MASRALIAVGAAVAVAVYAYVSGLRRNILKARKTGLVYLVLPCSPFNLLWQLTFWIWVPLIKLLPKAVWEDRLFVMIPDWAYTTGQTYFERLGTDTFLTVSPGEMLLHTQHPEVIHRMSQRHTAFPKDVARYGVLTMFGDSVLTVEGALWRMHRKVTSASFNEKNAAHTFAEAIAQTRGMLGMYLGPEGERTGTTKTITSLERDTMTWALNIIGYVGFGLRLLWPGQRPPADMDPKMAKYGSLEPPEGHTMTFADSLAGTLERILTIMITPAVLLKYLPLKFFREAYEAKVNFLQYMDEFLADKIEEAQSGGSGREGMDIMGQLVQTKYGPKASESATLRDSDIIGNAFIMMLAGHETSANTLHFALVELAAHPAAQRRLQRDIDALFGRDSDPGRWDYERYVNPMLASHVGACVYETLRMMPPVTIVPKIVSHDAEQTITVDGRTHVLPAGLSCCLLAVSAQRNPRWWPPPPSSDENKKASDMDDFVPDRWYRSAATGAGSQGSSSGSKSEEDSIDDKADYGGFQGSDVSASLYRPVRGSYLPFSDGPRSCLGRRIAMVELAGALAVVFQRYSVELAVDEWAGDDEVARMGPRERRAVYARAQARSRETMRQARSVLTLKLHGGRHVPVRIVRRGCERFVSDPELS